MTRLILYSVLALGIMSGCSSKPPALQSHQPTLKLQYVQNPEQQLCRDDTLSGAGWFTVPLAKFTSATVQLNDRAASGEELQAWADDFYRRRAERALWVQVSPDGNATAERALAPVVHLYPDLQLRQVEFGFTCPKLTKPK